MLELEATSRGELVIIRLEGQQTILGVCCTRCMLHSVYAATWYVLQLGVCCNLVLSQDHGMER
jgi:hypothetical protein